jgi:serine/threonine-protein kinase
LACVRCQAPCREVDRFCSQCGLPDPLARGAPVSAARSEPVPPAPANDGSSWTHTRVTEVSGGVRHADAVNDPPLPPGSVFAHRYRIERLLGEGGMGRVYLATDCTIDEPIALKFVSGAHRTNPAVLEQFKRELKLARKVRHRNVVASFHLGEAEGRSYITQEYIDADSLSALLTRRLALGEGEALGILCQVLRGLRAAHDLGIVHRDIKAGNILVNTTGMAFITDFGLALSGDQQGAARHVAGTVHHMAPELFDGAPATPASDLYACGVLLFQMLTGRFPILGGSFTEFGQAHRSTPPAPVPDELAVSTATRQLYGRLLAKRPTERPQRAVEVLEVFEDVLAADALKLRTGRPIALVADADADVCAMARELLEREGYQVEAVATARETLELAFSMAPSLLVVDSDVEGGRDIAFSNDSRTSSLEEILPRHGGLGLCRIMQRDPGLARVPILVVTAQRQPGLVSAFGLVGASGVIQKPFRSEELEAAVHAARQAALARADDA